MNVNIRGGFCQKLDELSVVLQQNAVDVACITETWLNPSISNNLTTVDGYATYRVDRDGSRQGGGVAILVKEDLPCQVLALPNPERLKTLWLLYRQPRMPRELSHTVFALLTSTTARS